MVRVHLGLPVDKSLQHNKVKKLQPIYGGVAQLGEHLPCKQGVMGSNPIISTITIITKHNSVKFLWLLSFQRKWRKENKMLIENRIEKKETKQIVVYWEKLVRIKF